MDDNTRRAALDYHRLPQPGKLAIEPTKRMVNQRDLALAYSPGVAAPCEEIAADPAKALDYTARGNLVAVISNGTAVLGLRFRGIRSVCRHAFLTRDSFLALVVLWSLTRLMIPLRFMGGSRFRLLRGHVVLLTRDVVA